jgi:hypothetical protein
MSEALPLPVPIDTGSSPSSVNKIANIQYNSEPTSMTINIPVSGTNVDMGSATPPQNKFTVKESNEKITINDDHIVINEDGQYYHNISVVFTIYNGVSPTLIRTALCQIVNADGVAFTGDTHYAVTETNGYSTRYEMFIIKTFVDHLIGDIVKLTFTTSQNNDDIMIKQIKWVVL